MNKTYYLIECIQNYKGEFADVDCDGTQLSDCDFITGQQYRARFIPNEAVIYPDNEWDGTYRYDYITNNEFNKYFKVIRQLKSNENLS